MSAPNGVNSSPQNPDKPEREASASQAKPESGGQTPPSPMSAKVSEEVPDIIAQMMKPKSFDIGQQNVEEFRAEAQRTINKIVNFQFGKQSGTSTGVALVTKRSAQITLKAVVRKFHKNTKFARPTPEFAEPELNGFLEEIHVVPAIDVTTTPPAGICIPFRITAWEGYDVIFDALKNLADDKEVLFLKYERGGGNDAGTYKVERSRMEPQHRVLWEHALWPTAVEAPALVPFVSFEDLIAESFIFRRAWAAVLRRKGVQQ